MTKTHRASPFAEWESREMAGSSESPWLKARKKTGTLWRIGVIPAGVLIGGLAWGAQAAEPPKIKHDWPCYTGPEGTFADQSKVRLLDDFSHPKLVWVSEHADLGWGKTVSSGGTARYPKTMAPSGSASRIVAGGLLIAGYFSPKNSADADDIILALAHGSDAAGAAEQY